ncbi:SIR2 family protein [Amycolatopsis sp. NPDC048633]|uniref:SIR2 family protein n=1 Tax=Amycolatopsis sp. NPDC048633 TaxID=3157095 RepID=UPI00340A7B9D
MLDALDGAASGQLVVFCGSGVSSVAPSVVPSWYRLNAAVLDGLRDLALTHVLTSASSRAAVGSLVAEDVPIVTFSQVLSDAFAGRFWLDVLTVLDGDAPNGIHRALAALLRDGRCHSIVTTNFDTLIEQACDQVGLALPVVVARTSNAVGTNPGTPAIHKIHGSVRYPQSMVDLLLDKSRGLDAGTRERLAAACRDRHLLVLGFSGDDFALNSDYLGLIANSALPEKVTWIARPGSELTAGARAFLDALAERGVAVAIERRQLQDLAGVTSNDGDALMDSNQKLAAHVHAWLGQPGIYPPVAGIVLAELLRLRGSLQEAAGVRAAVRLALPKFEQNGPHLVLAPAAWALLGREEPRGDLALADLRRAERAMDRFDDFARSLKVQLSGPSVVEQRLLRAAIRQNAALVYMRAGNVTDAERFTASAEEILATVPGPEAFRRIAGLRYQQALHALTRNELSRAMIQLETSVAYAVYCGDIHQEAGSTLMLAACLRVSGEEQLAAALDGQATKLGLMSNDAGLRVRAERLTQAGSSILASGMLDSVVAAIEPDPLLDKLMDARATGDPHQVAAAVLAVVVRDIQRYGGERLGQMLLGLELASTPSAASLYQQTVLALCAMDLSSLTERPRFLLEITREGLNLPDSIETAPTVLVDQRRIIEHPFPCLPYVFAPSGYDKGIQVTWSA